MHEYAPTTRTAGHDGEKRRFVACILHANGNVRTPKRKCNHRNLSKISSLLAGQESEASPSEMRKKKALAPMYSVKQAVPRCRPAALTSARAYAALLAAPRCR